MTKHTSGPWYAVGSWVEHANDEVPDICNCDPESMGQAYLGRSYDEMLANARLIAAAPDLLAALQTLMDLIELRGPRSIAPHKSPIEELRATLTKADYEAARAAIAKAKGDQA